MIVYHGIPTREITINFQIVEAICTGKTMACGSIPPCDSLLLSVVSEVYPGAPAPVVVTEANSAPVNKSSYERNRLGSI